MNKEPGRSGFRQARVFGLGKDMLVYGALDALTQGTRFLLLPIFTRIFSTDSFGAIDILATFTSLLTILVTISLPGAIQRFYYEFEDQALVRRLVSSMLGVVSLLGLAAVFIGTFLSQKLSALLFGVPSFSAFILLGIVSAVLVGVSRVGQSAIRMERAIVRYNITNLAYVLTYAGTSLVLVLGLSQGLIGVFRAQVFAAAIQLIFTLLFLRKKLVWPKIPMPEFLRVLRYSIPILPGLLVNWVNSQTNRIILVNLMGLGSVGVFGVAARISMLMGFATAVFQRSWFPFAMSMIKTRPESRDSFYSEMLTLYMGASSALAILLVFASPFLLGILAAPAYHEGIIVLPWLVGATFLHVASEITILGALVSEKSYVSSIGAWTGAVSNVGLTLLLVPKLGFVGAGIGQFTAELLFVAITWRFTLKYSNLRFSTLRVLLILTTFVSFSALFIYSRLEMENSIQVSRLLTGAFVVSEGVILLLLIGRRRTRQQILDFVSNIRSRGTLFPENEGTS